jgi:hypothetical protein
LKPGETISLATGESAWVSAGSDRAAWVLAAEVPMFKMTRIASRSL